MGALLKLIFCFYLISLSFSAFCAVPRFLIDVGKWKSRERREHIKSSALAAIDREEEENERKRVLGRNDGDTDGDGDRGNDGDGDGDTDRGNNSRSPIIF